MSLFKKLRELHNSTSLQNVDLYIKSTVSCADEAFYSVSNFSYKPTVYKIRVNMCKHQYYRQSGYRSVTVVDI